jgi:hypothetical protein
MPSSKGLDGTRQSCFVIATSMPPAPSPDLLRAERVHGASGLVDHPSRAGAGPEPGEDKGARIDELPS